MRVMKKLMAFLFFMSMIISGTASAKEYVFKEYHYAINIPDNFVVITKDYAPPEAVKNLEFSSEKLIKTMVVDKKALLFCYSIEDRTHFWVMATPDNGRTNIVDAAKSKDIFHPEKMAGILDSNMRNSFGATLKEIATYEKPDVYYIECDGEKLNKGVKQHIKQYLTIKNSIAYGINAISFHTDKSKINAVMRPVVDSARYDIGLTNEESGSKSGKSPWWYVFLAGLFIAKKLWVKLKSNKKESSEQNSGDTKES